jgi:hypothetical protein
VSFRSSLSGPQRSAILSPMGSEEPYSSSDPFQSDVVNWCIE